MISRDEDSLNMQISEDFAPMIQDTEVFLLSCFSEILDSDILADRMEKTRALLSHLPKKAMVVLEDGCYIKKDFRYYVHRELASVIDILSMNEDELQDYIGKRIDILDADVVYQALQTVYEKTGIKTILVHSASWALAYGEAAPTLENALNGGITMAATRFQWGDDFGAKEYEGTKLLDSKPVNKAFCEKITKLAGDMICCVPCKDLDFVKQPTVVGLGDFFVGGLLPGLLVENRNADKE
jgi:ADP-dependent phosphofructokinase/glucokinase